MLIPLIKKTARMILGDYSIYYIYSSSNTLSPTPSHFQVRATNESEIKASTDTLIQEQAGYSGSESNAYACFDRDRMIGICFYWFGDRYRARNFWPLASGEAKLVQIVTVPDKRGRGIATQLIAESCAELKQKGFNRLYARIWHSNTPSVRAFERAGWSKIMLVVEINPLRLRRPWRIEFNS